jgi:hypothetical protein
MTGKGGRSLRKSLKLTQKVHTFHFLDLAHATLCKVLRSAPGVFQASRERLMGLGQCEGDDRK